MKKILFLLFIYSSVTAQVTNKANTDYTGSNSFYGATYLKSGAVTNYVLTCVGPDGQMVWAPGGGGGGSLPLYQIGYGTGTGITSDSKATRQQDSNTMFESAFGVPNDTNSILITNNLFGFGITGIQVARITNDGGRSGLLSYNGTSIGGHRDDGAVGYFNPFDRHSADISWSYDSATTTADIVMGVQNSGGGYAIDLNSNIGITIPSLAGYGSGVIGIDNNGTISFNAGAWSLVGNANTNDGTNFVGTTDANGLEFRINNTFAGELDSNDTWNTSFGYESNDNNGKYNTAFGFQTLSLASANTEDNTAIGYDAMANTTGGEGSENTAIGSYSMALNVGGSGNTAIGGNTLSANLNGGGNVVIGTNAGSHGELNNRLFIDNSERGDSATQEIQSLITGTFGTDESNQYVRFNAHVTINDGTQEAGNVLTSDAYGNASWQKLSVPITDSIHITSAQLLAANVTPITLEPGIPGHNYQILAIREDYNYGSTAYTNGSLTITQDNTLTGSLFNDHGFFQSSISGTAFMAPIENAPGAIRGDALTTYAPQAIVGGNGSVDLFITYMVH